MSTSITTKIVRLIKNPTRLWPTVRWHTVHRVEAYAERRRVDRAIRELTSKTAAEYDAIRLDTLSSITGVDRQTLASFAAELRADTEFMAEYDEKLAEVVRIDPQVTTSMIDVTTLYCILRATKPQTLVETGVYFGGTSAFLLRALERNESGRLFSIDYLIPGVQPFGHPLGQGCLVPKRLQANWTLINGDSREELPKLLAKPGSINFFLHDSLHTYKHMSWEYKTAWQAMASGGILTSHDIALTNAFQDFMSGQKHEATGSALICNVGVMCKR